MQIKTQLYSIVGMNKDISYSKMPANNAIDCKNIRIDARDKNNLFRISNEKGNSWISIKFKGFNLTYEYVVIYSKMFRDVFYRYFSIIDYPVYFLRNILYKYIANVDSLVYEIRNILYKYTSYSSNFIYQTRDVQNKYTSYSSNFIYQTINI